MIVFLCMASVNMKHLQVVQGDEAPLDPHLNPELAVQLMPQLMHLVLHHEFICKPHSHEKSRKKDVKFYTLLNIYL